MFYRNSFIVQFFSTPNLHSHILYSMYGFFKFMFDFPDFSTTAEKWLGFPLTMLRCFFHLSWGVQIYLNFGFEERADKLINKFMTDYYNKR